MSTSNYIKATSREFATYVMEQRAIPIITDGLKLSQRIALWLLKDQTKPVKTAGLVGRMLESNLYVHGDNSAGDLIGRLAAPYMNNRCLIQGEGAFGTRVSPVDGIGAPRYTEVKRSKFAEEELFIDLDICPTRENYDGSKVMPQTFLPRIPLLLVNGIGGIAIGFACKILPRDVEELRTAVVEVIKTGKTTQSLLPKFESYNCEVIRDHGNKGKFHLRGRLHIENATTVQITELPPGMPLDKFKEHMISLEDDKKISSFIDNSTDKIAITVKMTRADLAKHTENSLITFFKMAISETENLTVLDPTGRKAVKYDNVQDIIRDFVEWRLGWYKTRYENLLVGEEAKCLFWSCYLSCFDSPGGGKSSLAASISSIKSRSDMVNAVIESASRSGLTATPEIIDRIVSMPVHKFTKEGQSDGKAKLKEAQRLSTEYTEIIANPEKRKKIYISELKE